MTYSGLVGLCLYLYLAGLVSVLVAVAGNGVKITLGTVFRAGTWPIALPVIAIIIMVMGL